MRKVISLIIFLSLSLSLSICFAQPLSSWEWDVYYDVVESGYIGQESYDDDIKAIANKYGITVEKVKDIESRGLDREPTEKEWAIADDLVDQLNALGKNPSSEARKRVYQQIAQKYGLTLRQLYDIDYRAFDWIWFF